jgi:predicted nucleic acid-binding protein
MKRVFADTSYFIAIIAPNDASHDQAKKLARQSLHLVTTAWVMTELAAYLSNGPNRSLFTKLLATVRGSAAIDFVAATQELFDLGAQLYGQRPDKGWSLVDCISFVVMEREGLTEALTADHHFKQAGFNTMLSEAGN